MGREVKRVALDFNWPLNVPWKGYMNPFRATECRICKDWTRNADPECPACQGNRYYWCDPLYEELAEYWEPIPPPEGEGWQLWETVSEGSPVSPVFVTPEELARWLACDANLHPRDIHRGTSYEGWLAFIVGPGRCPSFMVVDGEIKNPIEESVKQTGDKQ